MSQTITPRVFVSAASSDLRSARKVVNDALTRIECLPIEESVFGTEYGPIREMLARKIESCHAVIHLVGRDYGGEPDPRTLPAGQPRRSWTQIEYDLAKEQQPKQKLYLLVCDDSFPFDPSAVPESVDKSAVQLAHREAVLTDNNLWHPVRTLDELQRQIENLKVPLDVVRAELRRQQIRHRLVFGLAVSAIILVLSGVIYGLSQLGKKVDERGEDLGNKVAKAQQETAEQIEASAKKTAEKIEKVVQVLANPAVLADRIRKEIHATAEAKIKALPDEKGRGRMIAEIEKERDLALGRVDDLIKLIQEGLKEGASPVFQRAAEILQKEGTDEALAYLESRRPSTLATARLHAEQAKTAQARADAEKELRNKILQPLVLEAELLETKLQWEPALKLREQVAELAPDWFEARNELGLLHMKLANFRDAEPHLQAAASSIDSINKAIGLNNLGYLFKEMNRLSEGEILIRRALNISENPGGEPYPNYIPALTNLAQLLQETNRHEEAEPLMRRVLMLDEQRDGYLHANVATDLGNLAGLLVKTNRLGEAESLYRRAIAIDELSSGGERLSVASRLNNFAELLRKTRRFSDAETFYRRALAIWETNFGQSHPSVAVGLNNLALLLKEMNRLVDAEILFRRALVIEERHYGTDHPRVALIHNNLAMVLHDTNRLSEAELLYRRAIAIDEKSYGAEHPDLAIHFLNLGSLLQDTNRRMEGASLMRRALAILEQSYGTQHTDVAKALYKLSTLLQNTNHLADAEPLARRALAIDEQSYGSEHTNVASNLNYLAMLLQNTNRLAESEPLMRRALAIDVRFHGAEHPEVGTRLNNLAWTLATMNRLAEAEPLYRRAISIDEHAFGTGHVVLAIHLNNFARLLQTTSRPTAAELLARRSVVIFQKFVGKTKREHPNMQAALADYRSVLQAMKLQPDEVDQRVKETMETAGQLDPIEPEIERLLGPAKPVADVLETLDRQYKTEGKPTVYFLSLDQPIAPHLKELLTPNPDSLNNLGVRAFFIRGYADAILLYEESLRLRRDTPGNGWTTFTTCMNRAAALRELGEVEQAREELLRLLSGLVEGDTTPVLAKGRARYHLAQCEWRLGDRDAALREAEESLRSYGDAIEAAPQKKQTEQLLTDLKEDKSLPPPAKIDTVSALEAARVRFRARMNLATLPLDQSAMPLVDQMIGPTKSTQEVFDSLDRQYREQDKPAVWFVPLTEPIAPHLNELLGPVEGLKKE